MNAIGDISYSDAINTRFNYSNLQLGTNGTFPSQFQSTYNIDQRCPFFRIFAGVGATNFPSNALVSTFVFSNGGSVICTVPIMWGTDGTYNAAATVGLNFTPEFGFDSLTAHSQFAGVCTILGAKTPGVESFGFLCRWTALADQLVVTTVAVGIFTVNPNNSEFFQGYIQAPW